MMLKWYGSLQSADNINIFLLGASADKMCEGLCNSVNEIQIPYPTQSANSRVLGTVADKRIMFTCAGSIMITSSQTTPL